MKTQEGGSIDVESISREESAIFLVTPLNQ